MRQAEGTPHLARLDTPTLKPDSRQSPTPTASVPRQVMWLRAHAGRILAGIIVLETLLLLIAQIPVAAWPRLGLPNGPIPAPLLPLVAACFYLAPTAIGALCRRWYAALALATLPVWIALGAFAIAASGRLGFSYLAEDAHAAGGAGTLELFAGLGFLGWLLRLLSRDRVRRRAGRAE
jgi:hypothetical protein